MKTKKNSRKKNYVAVVSGVLWRKLIGVNLNGFYLIKEDENEFYFFSNSKLNYKPENVFKQIRKYANNGNKFCFGVIQMKNHKEYYFICEIDALYITTSITHVHKSKTIITKLKR